MMGLLGNGSSRAVGPVGVGLRLREGLRVESVGEDLLVLDADGDVVHTVTGVGVDVVRCLSSGVAVGPLTAEMVDAVASLVEAGIVEDDGGLSRRKVLVAGGVAWTAATVTTFALANPAAAATGCPGGIVPSTTFQYTDPGEYWHVTGPGTGSTLVRAWGAGAGGGGGGGKGTGGTGGGGGAYAASTLALTECTEYYVHVGFGGYGGAGNSGYGGAGGAPGEVSEFGAPALLVADHGLGGGASVMSGVGGAGGAASGSTGTVTWSGGAGGNGALHEGGGGGGGSAGSGGDGGAGPAGSTADVSGGSGGPGTPGGANGGTGSYSSPLGGAGSSPGGGGGGGSWHGGQSGGDGAPGAVWIGI